MNYEHVKNLFRSIFINQVYFLPFSSIYFMVKMCLFRDKFKCDGFLYFPRSESPFDFVVCSWHTVFFIFIPITLFLIFASIERIHHTFLSVMLIHTQNLHDGSPVGGTHSTNSFCVHQLTSWRLPKINNW